MKCPESLLGSGLNCIFMKKLIILDFDGTIADTRPVILNTFHRTLDAMDMPQHSENGGAVFLIIYLIFMTIIAWPILICEFAVGRGSKKSIAKAFPVLEPMDEEKAALCTETYRRIFEDVNAEIGVPMFQHVADTLRLLHSKDCTLTIATSRGYKSVVDFIKGFNVDDIINFIIAAEDVKHAKPDAEPVTKTLKHYGLKANDAVVIGDTHFDILMGRNAGCMTIGVTYGNGTRESLIEAGADAVVDDFAAITNYILL